MSSKNLRERIEGSPVIPGDAAIRAEKYPEHVKLQAISEDSQKIGNFIEWLRERGAQICTLDEADDAYWPGLQVHDRIVNSIQDILATYFDIDPEKIEEEKRTILEEMRTMYQTKDEADDPDR